MATSLKRRFSRGIGNAATAVGTYTVPASTTCAVKGLSVSSRSATAANVTINLTDSTGTVRAAIIEQANIPAGDTLVVIGAEQTVFLEVGDQIRVQAHVGTVDAIMSFAELS